MWNSYVYEETKRQFTEDLRTERRSAYVMMQDYKQAILNDDFESAKAITEVLGLKGFHTIETHREISMLND
jgi:hypothetical protein